MFIRRLFLIAALVYSHVVCAGPIYQYTDENGIRRFSDTAPNTDRPVAVSEGHSAEPEKKVTITATTRSRSTFLIIDNPIAGPVEVELAFEKLENLLSVPSLPKRFVVSGESRLEAVELKTLRSNEPSYYRYRYRYILGPPDARHDPATIYRLPYRRGEAYTISQAFNGTFSHSEKHSRHAVDFVMPVGTPIACARSGTVVAARDDYVFGGADRTYYLNKVNHLRIMHDDGTMSFYGHLKRGSLRVRHGERVSDGQVIAESGDTGFSSGPHLHFVVQKNEDMRWVSIPIRFRGENGAGIKPVTGLNLPAF